MANTLNELNTHLFAQMQRLNDPNLKGDELQNEIERAKAMSGISKDIVANASLQLEAIKLKAEHRGLDKSDITPLLSGKTE